VPELGDDNIRELLPYSYRGNFLPLTGSISDSNHALAPGHGQGELERARPLPEDNRITGPDLSDVIGQGRARRSATDTTSTY